MTKNRYLFPLINLLCVLIFIAGLFGFVDWVQGSVILVIGVPLSSFLGTFIYSKKLFKPWPIRLIFALGVLASGYAVFKAGEYLNKTVVDGMVTITVVIYALLVTILLFCLGRGQPS